MPRITASNVGEHVALQEQRVFDAAIRLFVERGYANVTFADIADAVGLARNSLYRYFPSKADILIRWFQTELEDRISRSTELLEPGDDPDPRDLIAAWVDDQLDYASRPEHALVVSMAQIEPNLAGEARSELFGGHSRLMAPVAAVLLRAGVDPTMIDATVDLIGGIVLSAARYESTHPNPGSSARLQVHRAINALVG